MSEAIQEISEEQLRKLIAILLTNTNTVGIPASIAQWAFQNPVEMAKQFSSFLAHLDIAELMKFVVREKFVVNTNPNARVKISGLGDNFQNWFLGLVEDQVSETDLNAMVLDRNMLDSEIIAKLGGVTKVLTSLQKVFSLMSEQPKGPQSKAGKLVTNGYANIFYVPQPVKKLDGNRFCYTNLAGVEVEEKVKDSQYLFEVNGQWGVLRAVDVYWCDDGWDVYADPVGRPRGWVGGFQVFARN